MDKQNSEAKGQSAGSDETGFNSIQLPAGIRSRYVNNNNDLQMHILEAGYEGKGSRPCVLLLHGFPEIAYSWRKIMPLLSEAGYYVVAPAQRGYGRTTGWDPDYDGDIGPFRLLNVARDALALVFALGYKSVSAVIGHDFGSPVAAVCSLIRPDVFRSVALMSAPYAGMPQYPFDTADKEMDQAQAPNKELPVTMDEALASLPKPRKHYQHYYSTREANNDMLNAPQGLHNFMRAYLHGKSGDWKQNKPFALKEASAEMLSKLPTYYIMDLDKGMAETTAEYMPTQAEIDACQWLSDEELKVYVDEYAITGFQGGLNW
jgi:pimeloyl-ACP methyl ester carboxylesterase